MIRSLLVLAALLLPALSQAQVKLLRHPTYSNGKVAFSYLGDLWIASENGSGVQRLTDNQARDVFPRFSPDGNWIAFSSNREGNYDVYVIPAAGGKPKQLTFHSGDDNVVVLAVFEASGTDSGVPLAGEQGFVWTVRDGQAVRFLWFNSHREALEAAGLEPGQH